MFSLVSRKKIHLRLFRKEDAQNLFHVINTNRSHLGTWLPWVSLCKNPVDSEKFIDKSIVEFEKSDAITLGVWEDSNLAGIIAFRKFEWEKDSGEIGYWLSQDFVGKGLMTKVCRKLITVGFNDLKLQTIIIQCAEGNNKSQAIPIRLNFNKTQVIKNKTWHAGEHVQTNNIVYTMPLSKWKALNQPLSITDENSIEIFGLLQNFKSKSNSKHKPRDSFIYLYNNYCKSKGLAIATLGAMAVVSTLVYCNKKSSTM